jgi:ABC-type bacteriocin/lantibiotic exporter with double-glycine peptidase domain
MSNCKFSKYFVKQGEQTDCGVASLLAIIKFYGGESTLDYLRNISGTNTNGTSLLGLYEAAMKMGFVAEGRKENEQFLMQNVDPVILHVVIDNNLLHYVVCFGTIEKNNSLRFVIGDPAKGIDLVSVEELRDMWRSGYCLSLKPNSHFKQSGNIAKGKRAWIANLISEDLPFLLMALLVGIMVASLGLIMAIFSQRLIDDILPQKAMLRLNVSIAMVLFLLVIKEILSAIRQYLLLKQSITFNNRITNFFYKKLLDLPKSFFDTRKTGDLTARLTDNFRIQKVIVQIAGNSIIDVLVTTVSLLYVFLHSWRTGLICLCEAPLVFWIIYLFNRKMFSGQRQSLAAYAEVEGNYISTLQGIDPIKGFNRQEGYTEQNKTIFRNYQDKIFHLGKLQIKFTLLAGTVNIFCLIAVLSFTSYQVINSRITLGELIAILSVCGYVFPSVSNLALTIIPVNEAKAAFDRMYEYANIVPESTEGSTCPPFQGLKVSNLSFRYPGAREILKNISFNIRKTEIIAIIGENGCGKSTLIQILQKFYIQEAGRVVINGDLDLSEISVQSWRKTVSVVPQNIHIFNATVLENIAFADARNCPEKVLEFILQNGFSTFVESLPQSYMTLIGEEGVKLSGGQKQLIGIMRAMYNSPQLLILDEATAFMDKNYEMFIIQMLSIWRQNMAIIVITHRIRSIASFCDRVYIIEAGVISASGDHQTLIEGNNLYSNYWKNGVQSDHT